MPSDAMIFDIPAGVPALTDEIELQRTAAGASLKTTLSSLFAASGFTLVAPNFVGPVTITSGQLHLADGSKPAPSLVFTTDQTTGWYKSGAGGWSWVVGGAAAFGLTATAVRVNSNAVIGWSLGETDTPLDTAFGRTAAGVAEVNSGVSGDFRDLLLRNLFFAVPSVLNTASGPTTVDTDAGYTTAIGDLVYLSSGLQWQKPNATSTYNGLLGIALEVKLAGQAIRVALPGSIIYASAFSFATPGAPVYMSETAGVVTQAAPITPNSATRIMGWALDPQTLYFFPSPDYVTHI